MENINVIFGFLGSVASIIGLIISFIKKESIRNRILFVVIVCLTTITAISSYNYQKITNEKLRIKERKTNMKNEAKKMYNNASISYWSPGKSEGLAYSLLFLLENNKDIYPEMYEIYQKNVILKIEKVDKESNMQKKREQMEIAGESAMQILSLIAK